MADPYTEYHSTLAECGACKKQIKPIDEVGRRSCHYHPKGKIDDSKYALRWECCGNPDDPHYDPVLWGRADGCERRDHFKWNKKDEEDYGKKGRTWCIPHVAWMKLSIERRSHEIVKQEEVEKLLYMFEAQIRYFGGGEVHFIKCSD